MLFAGSLGCWQEKLRQPATLAREPRVEVQFIEASRVLVRAALEAGIPRPGPIWPFPLAYGPSVGLLRPG